MIHATLQSRSSGSSWTASTAIAKGSRALLTEALLEGRRLREKEPGDVDDIEEWKSHVQTSKAALGEGSAEWKTSERRTYLRSAIHGSTSEQKQIERSTNRLHDLIEWVKSPQDIPFRSGFDPHKWEDWKSPPPTNEQARIDQLQAALNRVAWRRDSLSGRVRELEDDVSPKSTASDKKSAESESRIGGREIHGHMFASTLGRFAVCPHRGVLGHEAVAAARRSAAVRGYNPPVPYVAAQDGQRRR